MSSGGKRKKSNYCRKCDLTFKSKKRLRRHMLKEHVVVGKLACKNCRNLFNARKDLRVHIYKTHKNDKDKEGNKIITSTVRNCTGDDMKVTPKDIDDGEVNRDIVNKSESLISICEDSSKYYQINDSRKLQFKHTCSGCDAFPNKNHKLNPHLIKMNNGIIDQCETISITD